MEWIWAHPGAACAALLVWASFAAMRLAARGGGREGGLAPNGGQGADGVLGRNHGVNQSRDGSRPLHYIYARLCALGAAEGGAAAVEFALAAPVLLALVLITVQFALVAVARRAVEASAFAAARSAVVWVPAESGEGANRLRLSGESAKRERIERAAALALLPAAPAEALPPGGPPEPELAGPLRALASETGLAAPGELVRRYAAARARVRVAVAIDGAPDPGSVLVAQPADPLAVTVTYDCPLQVPLAARLLGGRDRRAGGFRAELSARCVLRNEGAVESTLVIGE
jgi:hypothetical protein